MASRWKKTVAISLRENGHFSSKNCPLHFVFCLADYTPQYKTALRFVSSQGGFVLPGRFLTNSRKDYII
jgi:hypothetical protein